MLGPGVVLETEEICLGRRSLANEGERWHVASHTDFLLRETTAKCIPGFLLIVSTLASVAKGQRATRLKARRVTRLLFEADALETEAIFARHMLR